MHKIILVGTLGRLARTQESAVYDSEVEASVQDRVGTRAPDRSCASVVFDSAAMAVASTDAKAFATLQAHFALYWWKLDLDPRIDGCTTYLISRLGHSTRVLNSFSAVSEALLQIGGAT